MTVFWTYWGPGAGAAGAATAPPQQSWGEAHDWPQQSLYDCSQHRLLKKEADAGAEEAHRATTAVKAK